MTDNKKIDAVQMMREIREKLSERYWKKPDVLKREMKDVLKKYNLKPSTNLAS